MPKKKATILDKSRLVVTSNFLKPCNILVQS